MPSSFDAAQALLPEGIAASARSLPPQQSSRVEEIRLRLGFPPSLTMPEGERSLGARSVTAADIAHVLDRASRSSLHSVQRELRQGFITAAGGLRIGVCGTVAGESIRDFSSLAIRLPHEVRGAGGEIMDALRPFARSVLIISPPGGGKTTFLRELIRRASCAGARVSLCDERGEVAAVWQGRAAFDLGSHTDILSGVGKSEGIMMLLRAMNPDIIALDEVSAAADMEALEQAQSCGAAVYATAHSSGVEELRRRGGWARLLDAGMFHRAVIIEKGAERSYKLVDLC